MFGFSWAEILLTAGVALVVIGPKDIPKVMFQLGRVARRLQYIKYAFSQQFEDFLKEHDLDDIRHSVNFEARDFKIQDSGPDILAEKEANEGGALPPPARNE